MTCTFDFPENGIIVSERNITQLTSKDYTLGVVAMRFYIRHLLLVTLAILRYKNSP